MLSIAIVIAAVVVATPLAAAVLVTFASLREDAAHSLSGRPPGWIEATVRHLLGNANTGRQAPPRRRVNRGDERPDLPPQFPQPRHIPLPRHIAQPPHFAQPPHSLQPPHFAQPPHSLQPPHFAQPPHSLQPPQFPQPRLSADDEPADRTLTLPKS